MCSENKNGPAHEFGTYRKLFVKANDDVSREAGGLKRARTPLFGNGAGAHGIGKISNVLTKIGKFDIVLFHC